MKRINTETGLLFKRGDTRPQDEKIFSAYRTTYIKKDGYFQEQWLSPDTASRKKTYDNNWRKANPDKNNAYQKKFRHIRPNDSRKIKAKYRKENRDKENARNAKRRAAKIQRTPNWLTKAQIQEIEDFYVIAKMFQMYTGEMYHVDHIVPLRGKKISGLHVPWNLQVLQAKENIKKHNKF